MKIATFNVNSVRARLPIITQWIVQNQPDALCLQETKVQDHEFPLEPFTQIGYNCTFKGEKSYNGVAMLSPHEILNPTFGFDEEPKDEPRLLTAKIQNLNIVNTYVPQGFEPDSPKFQYKLQWFDRLHEFFKMHYKPSDLLIWLGDFNIAPEARDVYDPVNLLGSVCFHPDVQKALQNVVQWGFTDLFRKFCDEPGQYTFWDYRLPNSLKRNLGWRLDHIMATKSVVKKCTACYIDKNPRTLEKPSDHTPLVAELNLC
ncbi:MAG: exodeoxyribonuclease III [Phycisphaerae bacterium]